MDLETGAGFERSKISTKFCMPTIKELTFPRYPNLEEERMQRTKFIRYDMIYDIRYDII